MGLGAIFSIFIVVVFTIPMELPGVSINQVAIVTAAVLTIGNGAGVISPIFVGSLTDTIEMKRLASSTSFWKEYTSHY